MHSLDNPAWHSLTEIHQHFAVDYDDVKFYYPDYCPFGAFLNPHKTAAALDAYSSLTNHFYVVGEKPFFSDKLSLTKKLVCNQMLLEKTIAVEICEPVIQLQTANHRNDLFSLVNTVQPGYFRTKTAELGNYYGIYKDDKLIAVTGERMKMNAYTEVSAVVTHPAHIGKGYAKQLIAHTTNIIFGENKIPYLHVAETNIAAIKLYENLGFGTRCKISFWNVATKPQ